MTLRFSVITYLAKGRDYDLSDLFPLIKLSKSSRNPRIL